MDKPAVQEDTDNFELFLWQNTISVAELMFFLTDYNIYPEYIDNYTMANVCQFYSLTRASSFWVSRVRSMSATHRRIV